MTIIFKKEQDYLPIVQQAADDNEIPVALLLAHAKQESNFDSNARRDERDSNGNIWDSSFGLVQLLLRTAQSLDPEATPEKLFDPAYNLNLAAQLISNNLDRYNGNVKDAIAAYNSGSNKKNAQGQYVNSKGVPNVQNYVDKVYQNYVDYSKWLENGANLIDVSINPWLVAGFATVLLLTLVGGGVYVSRRKGRKSNRLIA